MPCWQWGTFRSTSHASSFFPLQSQSSSIPVRQCRWEIQNLTRQLTKLSWSGPEKYMNGREREKKEEYFEEKALCSVKPFRHLLNHYLLHPIEKLKNLFVKSSLFNFINLNWTWTIPHILVQGKSNQNHIKHVIKAWKIKQTL